jgi:hypothetical protein
VRRTGIGDGPIDSHTTRALLGQKLSQNGTAAIINQSPETPNKERNGTPAFHTIRSAASNLFEVLLWCLVRSVCANLHGKNDIFEYVLAIFIKTSTSVTLTHGVRYRTHFEGYLSI